VSSSISSSSLGATTSIFECFGLLNLQFPIITILDAVSPILYFQFLHIISYVIFPSLVSLVVFLTSVSTYTLFLPFSLLTFDVNGQST
jgi:hypothetical protein